MKEKSQERQFEEWKKYKYFNNIIKDNKNNYWNYYDEDYETAEHLANLFATFAKYSNQKSNPFPPLDIKLKIFRNEDFTDYKNKSPLETQLDKALYNYTYCRAYIQAKYMPINDLDRNVLIKVHPKILLLKDYYYYGLNFYSDKHSYFGDEPLNQLYSHSSLLSGSFPIFTKFKQGKRYSDNICRLNKPSVLWTANYSGFENLEPKEITVQDFYIDSNNEIKLLDDHTEFTDWFLDKNKMSNKYIYLNIFI